MKVVIQLEKKKFFIIMPTSLWLNRFFVRMGIKLLKQVDPTAELEVEDIMKLVNVIKKYKDTQKHKRWEVVDIHTASGERVYISL